MGFSLFSNSKWVHSFVYLIETWQEMKIPSGPFLVSRTGDAG